MSRINDMVNKMYKIYKLGMSTQEEKYIKDICDKLKEIQQAYSTESINDDTCWKKVYNHQVKNLLVEIINIISAIEEDWLFGHFTAKEYKALKDYFAMVISWAKLIDDYPHPEALKYDPIYIFYLYLSNVRTTIITRTVTESLIKSSNKILGSLNATNREDFLLECNKKWIDIYSKIQNTDLHDVKNPEKERKKRIKDSVRTCFLVQFGKRNESGTITYDPDVITKNIINKYYDFDDTYCCLLNIIGCIRSQYIGSTRVNFMTQTSDEIVSVLLQYYQKYPQMLPYSHRKHFPNVEEYKGDKIVNINSDEMYYIVDYVAGMTDRMAKKKYDEIKSSDTKWSNDYSSGLI